MASLARQIVLKPHFRYYATTIKQGKSKQPTPRKAGPKIDSTAASLAAKGFLRPQKQYTPPNDVKSQLETVFNEVLGTVEPNARIGDFQQRFKLFCVCEDRFQHKIPNSLLHTIETVGDVARYYETPVDTITPLDNLKNIDLPKNVHVQYDYHRFHPDTDTKFGGVTAFPGSSTIVTGLKYKDKYKGHKQKHPFPHI